MKTETNEKVLAMYQAVWAMLDEGQDMSKMKVSDITTRAGIGKGTAYEYFRSKEEILSRAMNYDFQIQYQIILERVKKQESFRSALECCFDWLEENEDRRRLGRQFIRHRNCPESPEDTQREFCKMQSDMAAVVNEVLGHIVKLGRDQGYIRKGITDKMAILQILFQLVGFFIYRELGNPENRQEIQMMKGFLCDNIEKSLR